MANRNTAERARDITEAAAVFATQTRDANSIAAALNTSASTIHRWSKDPKWMETLACLGYTGELNFRVNPRRKKG